MATKSAAIEPVPAATPKRHRATAAFPKNTLKEALRLPEAIKDQNAGRPLSRVLLAKAVGLSPASSVFRTLIASANKYNLIQGNQKSDSIAMSSLAKSIVMPTSEKEKGEAIITALFNVPLFDKFFKHFKGNRLPRADMLYNILHRDYDIPIDDTKLCSDVVLKNAKELGLIKNLKGAYWVEFSQISISTSNTPNLEEEKDQERDDRVNFDEEENTQDIPRQDIPRKVSDETVWKPNVFIAHSKNANILKTIKRILKVAQFEHRVAEEVQTASIPIPEKVFGIMKKCNCAIINVSADEQEKMPDDSYRINENVLIEIGASYLAYDRRVILLVDKRIKLPSNLQGLARYDYEGEDLPSDTALDLLESLADFRTPPQPA